MQVDEKSQELLTIVTHKGLYRYYCLPFGIMSAPALFQRAMDQILCGLPGVQCYPDDILVTGRNEVDHLKNLEATLQRLEEYSLRVCKDKCEFFQSSVEYLGHIMDAAGLHKAPAKVKAPPFRNVSQLHLFLGLLNYYGKFISQLATLLKPFYELLGQNKTWKWTEACNVAFNKAKDALLNSEVLTHFDPSLPLQLACDASPYGVGAVMSHIMPSGEARPIAFASRTLSKAETNYAQIEREALGIIFGMQKFHQYPFGRKFTLLTDHRPLTSIFGPYTGIPPLAASHMQCWALLLSAHTYEIKYRKSTLHGNADGLSRLSLPVKHQDTVQKEIFYFEHVENTPITATQIKKATRVDPVLSQVMDLMMHGKSRQTSPVSPDLVTYMSRRLSIQSGCLLCRRHVIIPPPLRSQMLEQLHSGHRGIVRMKEIAQSYFWWPELDSAIEEKARACMSCQGVRNAPQWVPLHPWDWPENPWQRIHVDFAGPLEGSMFLVVVVDAHSKWPEVSIMQSTTAESTIQKLRGLFSHFGLPEQLVSDNGPQFVSQEFQNFMKANGIHHIMSAPYHPSTNALAERFVQTMKQALKSARGQHSIQKHLGTFLLSYRNTPHATTKASPTFLMMG
ncbi:unnamed protein product [Caretta caretta]